MQDGVFTSAEAATFAGYDTSYMIDYLVRSGIIKPSISGARGRGKKRYFSFSDIIYLKMIRQLLDKGISVAKIKKATSKSNLQGSTFDKFTEERTYLLTDGNKIFRWETDQSLMDLTSSGQLTFAFVINMSTVVADVVDLQERYKGRRIPTHLHRNTQARQKRLAK